MIGKRICHLSKESFQLLYRKILEEQLTAVAAG